MLSTQSHSLSAKLHSFLTCNPHSRNSHYTKSQTLYTNQTRWFHTPPPGLTTTVFLSHPPSTHHTSQDPIHNIPSYALQMQPPPSHNYVVCVLLSGAHTTTTTTYSPHPRCIPFMWIHTLSCLLTLPCIVPHDWYAKWNITTVFLPTKEAVLTPVPKSQHSAITAPSQHKVALCMSVHSLSYILTLKKTIPEKRAVYVLAAKKYHPEN